MDDDTIEKTCANECGAECCSGDIYVSEKDAKRLRNAGYDDFLDTKEAPRTIQTDEDHQCLFLNESNKCSIYNHRPVDCQLFPLGINVVGDYVEIVLVDCPLSELMTEAVTSELVEEAKSVISAYTPADLRAYDELAFTSEYTVLEKVPIDQLQLAEPST